MADHPVRSLGRPREFELDEVLDSALDLFWKRGFRATTTRDLEAELGITQSSMYNAFGSKRDLLLAAIDRYEAQVEKELLVTLTQPGADLEGVDRFFSRLGRWVERHEHRGCLVVNLMASETGDDVIRGRVVAYRKKIRSALHGALMRSFDAQTAELRTEALLAAVLGLHITARTGQPGEVDRMLRGIRAEIAGWQEALPA